MPVIPITLTARAKAVPELPSLFRPAARSVGQPADPFLPADYLVPTGTFDVGPSARAAEGVVQVRHDVQSHEIVVLELADGGTFITSAERLRASLARSQPELLGPNGEIQLDKLREEGAARRGFLKDAVGGLISKVFTLLAGEGHDEDDIVQGAVQDKMVDIALLGVSWAGTKALMCAIENKLKKQPGKLYRWVGGTGQASDLEPPDLPQSPDEKPMLVFVHGTASSTLGSFGDLRTGDREVWSALDKRFPGGIYAFEHRTLSESPIENAIQLATALPAGARVSLVSHSRGGLVADLVCLGDFDPLIDSYHYAFPGTGDADPKEAERVLEELRAAHEQQRGELRELAALLREKKLVIERYVRSASPANGTKLASGNFDLFLSGLLTLIGTVPFFLGSPYYSAFKRVVIDIAKNRTNPHLVPGIEAMLPDSPMAHLLRNAPVRSGVVMSVIAGDVEGGNMLQRLGVLLTDFLLFENTDNDLVVDTEAMLSGIAPSLNARVLFDRGADVTHFRYFTNFDTRNALRSWLVDDDPTKLDAFQPLPSPGELAAALAAATRRDVASADRPVVVVLPGIMGSHLNVSGKDRVWLNPGELAMGGLAKVRWGLPGIEAETLFGLSYGELCNELATSHRVEPFAYDWRQPLDVLAERLGAFLERLLKETNQPIRLLAHSMGGLVVRACIYKRRSIMDTLMSRDGARIVMCGTPHQGSHSMVENLLGKGDMLRTLVRLDLQHDMQEVLDIVSGFRGALQLLPRPGFRDTFQGQDEGGEIHDYGKAETWTMLKEKVRDFWFGPGRCGTPDQDALDASSWLWAQDTAAHGDGPPALPEEYERKAVYVFGVARNTPCGVREARDGPNASSGEPEETSRLKMVGTTRGDGTVTWDSGRIGGIGAFYYLPASHGDLLATREFFPGLIDLLVAGATSQLSTVAPAVRAIEQPVPVTYDAGPPTTEHPESMERAIMGTSLRNRIPQRAQRRLEVTVRAMDLRFLNEPVLVGHYEQDPIAGAESLIDRELLDGELTQRHNLGLYAGPCGTAVVVLRLLSGFGKLRGAVVTGLGGYDRPLSSTDLTDAVRTAALRYLLHIVDVAGRSNGEVSLATLLLGYNSSANLSVADSVQSLVRGVMDANARFSETTHLSARISRLNIIELYRDTAITAVYALRELGDRLSMEAKKTGTALVICPELQRGEGVRQRLYDDRSSDYWPRLMVTGVDRSEESATPAADGVASASVESPRRAAPIAERLRFLYVGQRARAESVMLQRQPGLVEKLIRQQIHSSVWQEDLGRMLFQLMVPHDFKDAARQLARVILVVDSYTANLPWELMLADDVSHREADKRPLALRTPVVRQLASSRFRRQVRQSMSRNALVIGNPSVTGFTDQFLAPPGMMLGEPPDLSGAEQEAEEIERVLEGLGYQVRSIIGRDCEASVVLAGLYREPYRILHVSAHGVFDLPHRDGGTRSGIVLSDGLLITAAEIDAMENVPELVFLNCCHLGQIDLARDANRLAASIARELIDIGVRCVVVAGWAVNDKNASTFGQAFYRELLLHGKAFGEAVFEARQVTWNNDPTDITWGAFQAYGDAGWRAEVARDGAYASDVGRYASPDEVLDALARVRAEVARKADRQTQRELRALATAVEETVSTRCAPSWLTLPELQSALGQTWRDLERFDKARTYLLSAIQAEDLDGQVPIRDIEQLANVEAKLGEDLGQTDLIRRAIERLETLDRTVAEASEASEVPASTPRNAERAALRGSAYKRLASVAAQRLCSSNADESQRAELVGTLCDAVTESANAYRSGQGAPETTQFSPYAALNGLSMQALLGFDSDSARADALALAEQCRLAVVAKYSRSLDIWDTVMQADVLVVTRLLDGKLSDPGEDGEATLRELTAIYDELLRTVLLKPNQLDSVVSQLETMSRFCDAFSVARRDPSMRRAADRLLQIASQLRPGTIARGDRPAADVSSPQRGREHKAGKKRTSKRTPNKGKPPTPGGD